MNPTLARLYGTGMSKTASDASAEAGAELDLNNISAADFLQMLQEQEASEKTAGDGELDLSQMTAQELIELSEQVDAEDATIEKMAQSGDLQYWDAAGRIMAHAYANELEKVSSSNADEFEIDLNNTSAEDLMALIDQGYEFVKEAALDIKAMRAAGASVDAIRKAMKQNQVVDRGGKAVSEFFGGAKATKKGLSEFNKSQPSLAKMRKTEKAARRAEPGVLAKAKQRVLGSGGPKELMKARPGAALGLAGGAGATLGGLAGWNAKQRSE